jgi:hypothetical protein
MVNIALRWSVVTTEILCPQFCIEKKLVWKIQACDLCHTEIAKKIKIVETYRHDHALEMSWGALSDGTITFSIQLFPGENAFPEFF